MNDGGVLRERKAIKFVPIQTLTKLAVGDPIRLREADVVELSSAFFAELAPVRGGRSLRRALGRRGRPSSPARLGDIRP